jgi:hypothetical protein
MKCIIEVTLFIPQTTENNWMTLSDSIPVNQMCAGWVDESGPGVTLKLRMQNSIHNLVNCVVLSQENWKELNIVVKTNDWWIK